MIEVRTKYDWTITGPAWITGLPLSGSGDFDYDPVFATNTTGSYRNGVITITIPDCTYSINTGTHGTITIPGEVIDVPVIQYASPYIINGKIFILGLDSDEGQKVKYSVTANGVTQTNSDISCGESVDIFGRMQTGIIPKSGATVTVRAYMPVSVSDPVKLFIPSFGNNVYWKISSSSIESAEDVISTGTAVTMSYSSGYYEGSFTATYGSNDVYFYIVFDYRNQKSCGSAARLVSAFSYYPLNVRINYTPGLIGKTSIDYSGTGETKLTATYNGNVVVDNAVDSSSYSFSKIDPTVNYVDMLIDSDTTIEGVISVGATCASTTGFTIVTAGSSLYSTSCSLSTPTGTRYHNGTSTYPSIGDTIYTSGSTVMNGANLYYKIPANSSVIKISTDGLVTDYIVCTSCTESSVPTVNEVEYTMYAGGQHQVQLIATGSPIVWRLTSGNYNYTIDGSTSGGNYSYTSVSGEVINDTIGIGQVVYIVSTTLPICDTGITCTTGPEYIAYGFSIDNSGILTLGNMSPGLYQTQVIAENCMGESTPATITIRVNPQPTLKPVLMSDEGKDDITSACSLSTCQQTFWFNGGNDYPAVNDYIYIDGYGKDYFNGGYQYYRMDNNNYILINGIGQVVELGSC